MTAGQCEAAVLACLARVQSTQETVGASVSLVSDMAERLYLDEVGLESDLVAMCRNARRAKANLRYAEGALDQALQELKEELANEAIALIDGDETVDPDEVRLARALDGSSITFTTEPKEG